MTDRLAAYERFEHDVREALASYESSQFTNITGDLKRAIIALESVNPASRAAWQIRERELMKRELESARQIEERSRQKRLELERQLGEGL